jgi:hypothetical protein
MNISRKEKQSPVHHLIGCTWLTVVLQAIKAALMNPVKA